MTKKGIANKKFNQQVKLLRNLIRQEDNGYPNNSIVDTVIQYANVKSRVELEKDAVASNLKELSYSQTLH